MNSIMTAKTLIKPAGNEKRSVAASSAVAAVGLTGFKLVVGLATGSLGILAEAAHSGLDLVAAIMTWFAVRISDKPIDRHHTYGHGKVENLSAFIETLLLLVTCAWIVYEAANRIIKGQIHVEVTIWSFLVMIFSIVVDISRARALHRVAKKYNSQALEADALHFSTDIWSSAVVILGLGCVALSDVLPRREFLHQADAVAAIIVAAIVISVTVRLGVRTVHALIDAAPPGMEDVIISSVEAIPGVEDCHNVRMRYSGAQFFVDIHVRMDGRQTLEEAHRITERIEEEIQKNIPGADVTVHPEPHTNESCDQ